MTTIPLRFSQTLMRITDHALLTKHIVPAFIKLAKGHRVPAPGECLAAVTHSLSQAEEEHNDVKRWTMAHYREMRKLRVKGKYRPSSKDKATYRNDNWG